MIGRGSPEAWGPMAGLPVHFDAWPAGKFAEHVRDNHDPLWRAEADCDPDEDRARKLADEIIEDALDGGAVRILLRAGAAERQMALRILRERGAADPPLGIVTYQIEDMLEKEYRNGRFFLPGEGDWYE